MIVMFGVRPMFTASHSEVIEQVSRRLGAAGEFANIDAVRRAGQSGLPFGMTLSATRLIEAASIAASRRSSASWRGGELGLAK